MSQQHHINISSGGYLVLQDFKPIYQNGKIIQFTSEPNNETIIKSVNDNNIDKYLNYCFGFIVVAGIGKLIHKYFKASC